MAADVTKRHVFPLACACEVSCRVRARLIREGVRMGAGDRPSGPIETSGPGFTPRKLEASRDGFPAAVRAFLLLRPWVRIGQH